jgi:hypothetical protein
MIGTIKSRLAALLALGSISWLCSAGCDLNHGCATVAIHSGALLTLHLPPAADVVAPETLTACRQPDCVTATLPPPEPVGMVAQVDVSSADVRGSMSLAAGGVRVLQLDWTVRDINPADPQNYYSVDVKDAAGTTTGHVANGVTYVESMPNGEGCGTVWNTTLSD